MLATVFYPAGYLASFSGISALALLLALLVIVAPDALVATLKRYGVALGIAGVLAWAGWFIYVPPDCGPCPWWIFLCCW